MTGERQPGDDGRTLYGPSIQYPDGTVVPGEPVDVNTILAKFHQLDADGRSAFLCTIAHDLTVAIRSAVYDAEVAEDGLERVKWINEVLHQLTSCVNPYHRWTVHDEAELIRGIIEDGFRHGFDRWIGRSIAVAATAP
ncbi:MAG: hypothetical protein JO305_05720 [Alphaproteobacteria bacterium]|nr:hypothetical protein [Alphaproteobacteria bacterium]